MVENFNEKADFIWSIADLLRGDYKQSEYQKVILPLTVLRRLDCVTQRNKENVLERYEQLQEQGIENVAPALKKASGEKVYNTSEYTFESLCNDPDQIASNLQYYINSYDEETREIFDKFDFDHQIQRLDEADLLYQVMEEFKEIDLHPDKVPNEEMGYIYEELIRKFNELSNETAGEHFTPREVIQLMVNLIFDEDDEVLTEEGAVRTVYDPACGTGGMLSVAQDHVRSFNEEANVHVFGQELNPESYAVCNSDMLIKGQEPENIAYGNSFTNDGFPDRQFDYMLSNPPFGVSWKKVKDQIEKEHEEQGFAGRFGAGTPRVNDGAFLFLQHMISKMKPPEEGGSRIAIVFNGSPLFNGGPNSGESAIRRWIIENDWLEGIVGLPENLFYNTGIRTYIWILSNNKPEHREGKVQLIDAQDLYEEMDESLGDKRHRLTEEHIKEITRIFGDLEANGRSKIVDGEEFGYRRIVIDQPLRLRFEVNEGRIEDLVDERAFSNRDEDVQQRIKETLSEIDEEKVWMDRESFLNDVELQLNMAGLDVRDSVYNAIERVMGERDLDAEICRDGNGDPEYDGDLREKERVPLGVDPRDYFEEEVAPYLENAWINESSKYHDDKDGELGVVGYEINFDRFFFESDDSGGLQEVDAQLDLVGSDVIKGIEDLISGENRVHQAVTKGLHDDVEMKDSGVGWIGEVPEHWDVVRTRFVSRLESGHTPDRSNDEYWEDTDIPWVTTSDIKPFRKGKKIYLHDTEHKISQLGLENSGARLLPEGTVFLSRTASVGFSGIMGQEMATSQDFANWVCGDDIIPEYLLYVFRSMDSEFERLTQGSTHQTIYMPDIRSFKTPLPPVEEQREIVEHIQAETEKLWELIEKTEETLDLLEEKRKTLINAAVTGQINVTEDQDDELETTT